MAVHSIMASIPVNIQGTMTFSDVGIGGGPMPGGSNPPYVDIGFPGPQPPRPIIPGGPGSPPLEIWGPITNYPDAGFPGPQPGKPPQIWGGPYFPPVIWDPSRPTNPIVNPGDPNHPGGETKPPLVEWKTAWSPTTGWVVVGVPTGEIPTPSSSDKPQSP